MSDIRDVVYAVTAKGFSALRSNDAAISLELKTVLTMIDGVSPVAQYIPFLQVFAPLEEKFEALEQLGLVRQGLRSKCSIANRTLVYRCPSCRVLMPRTTTRVSLPCFSWLPVTPSEHWFQGMRRALRLFGTMRA
jgi:hypothetical protein